MTLYEFNQLERDDKLKTVWQQGVFIDNYVTQIQRCNLYAIDRFFVEVVYNSELNNITEIRSFKTGRILDKYSIDLSKGI